MNHQLQRITGRHLNIFLSGSKVETVVDGNLYRTPKAKYVDIIKKNHLDSIFTIERNNKFIFIYDIKEKVK